MEEIKRSMLFRAAVLIALGGPMGALLGPLELIGTVGK